jgi:hypothetical protein
MKFKTSNDALRKEDS